MGLDLVTAIFNVAEVSLSLLEEREKNYTVKKTIQLSEKISRIKTEWYKEYNRDPKTRSDAVLDHLEFELCQCLSDIAACFRSPDLSDK
jgi:hypothetical protein